MKRLLIEYQIFVSRVEEIEKYLTKVDRNSTIEKISSLIPGSDVDISEYFEEYARNPEITRSRMYYEAISEILPDVKLYINTAGSDDVQMLLPLESLIETSEGEN